MNASNFFDRKTRQEIERVIDRSVASITVHHQEKTQTGWMKDQNNIAVNTNNKWAASTVAHEIGHIFFWGNPERGREVGQAIESVAQRIGMDWQFAPGRPNENTAIFFAQWFGVSKDSFRAKAPEFAKVFD